MGRIGLFIGELATRSGTTSKTIRYYESIGLLPQPPRGENRYRLYSKDVVELLAFIKKAQELGFALAEIREIVGLHQAGNEPCVHVRALVGRKIAQLDQQLNELIALRRRLKRLLATSRARRGRQKARAVICPHIEGTRVG